MKKRDYEKVGISSTWSEDIPAGLSYCMSRGLAGFCNKEDCPCYATEKCELDECEE
ncbi:hypothetical protein [Fusobacterium ulcerans]|uniref:Uncharacterized protein n=1 Tax=Fusobacterium ulcerans 12-1B TaxID=457404 RepID=H1PVN2_9FUSO|nr:hypothetical protein [Fusobacterium ulcerans]EHO79736.1 hypothetical protein HMPREF0402_02475 [Fusobacterium ulcerans 12-1B]